MKAEPAADPRPKRYVFKCICGASLSGSYRRDGIFSRYIEALEWLNGHTGSGHGPLEVDDETD